jgi:hypothetical protein
MTTEIAKPEGEDVGPFRAGQAKRRAGGANRLLRMLGPGLVTGVSDDDPSEIGTYSQVGAQFGYGLLWTMLISYPGHVLVLAASIRSLEHLLYCFDLQTELATVPAKILELWDSKNLPTPDNQFQYKVPGRPIPYEELDLEQGWETFDIQHELTRKGIEKFAADYRATLSRRIARLNCEMAFALVQNDSLVRARGSESGWRAA